MVKNLITDPAACRCEMLLELPEDFFLAFCGMEICLLPAASVNMDTSFQGIKFEHSDESQLFPSRALLTLSKQIGTDIESPNTKISASVLLLPRLKL